jgi:thiosulfate/3-mercaptopyruvate sulfurtransferase
MEFEEPKMLKDPLISPEAMRGRGSEIRILDCRPGAEAYAGGHLEGALHADLDSLLSAASDPGFDPAKGGRHPLPPLTRWAAQLGQWGITPDTTVVVYDDAFGGNGGARAWWLLMSVGHQNVLLLDGGMKAALQAGFTLTTEVPAVAPTSPYPVVPWSLPTADIDQVDLACGTLTSKVLDVRAAARWRGETEPFDPVAGRIPGTVNLPFLENLDEGGRFKQPEALRIQYLALLGDVNPQDLIVHCGSGVTACHTLLAMERAGLPGASLYVGSYSEWCRSGRPIGRG